MASVSLYSGTWLEAPVAPPGEDIRPGCREAHPDPTAGGEQPVEPDVRLALHDFTLGVFGRQAGVVGLRPVDHLLAAQGAFLGVLPVVAVKDAATAEELHFVAVLDQAQIESRPVQAYLLGLIGIAANGGQAQRVRQSQNAGGRDRLVRLDVVRTRRDIVDPVVGLRSELRLPRPVDDVVYPFVRILFIVLWTAARPHQ